MAGGSRAASSLRGAERRSNPSFRLRRDGLLRFARNDGVRTIPRSRGTKCPSGASFVALEEKRAQGMPDAGTHPLPCVQNGSSTHASRHRYAEHSGIPCAMVLRLTPRSPRCTGLVSHRRLAKSSRRLDPSVGGTGPHGLAVRKDACRRRASALKHPLVHRIPLPTSVTIAIRPSCGGGMGGYNHNFLKNGREIFFAERLDAFLIKRSDLPVGLLFREALRSLSSTSTEETMSQ